jgi:hypothetical protein
LNSCDDEQLATIAQDESIPGSGTLNGCVESDFAGVDNILNIKDTSVKLNWANDPLGIGFSIFKRPSNDGQLELIKSVLPTITELTVNDLTSETDYQFLVKTISATGLHDCNTNYLDAKTLTRQTFKSCFDILQYYGQGKSSGEYEVDTDLDGPNLPQNVYCDMDRKGGGWTRVLVHKTTAGLFANDTEALNKNADDTDAEIYSVLGRLEEFKRDNKFEFWLHYPEVNTSEGGNHWTQTSNPTTDSIADYTPITINDTTQRWGGLEKSNSRTLINGSVGHNNWFYAIGSKSYWPSNGTIPGPSTGITEVYLYIR